MYTKIQVVVDARRPGGARRVLGARAGLRHPAAAPGFATWEDFGRSIGMPEERFGDQTAIVDPDAAGPRVYFQRVPEGKTAKNRVHLDVRVAHLGVRGEERERLVEEHVARLVEAGAAIAWRLNEPAGSCVVMRDPEGNEFCVA